MTQQFKDNDPVLNYFQNKLESFQPTFSSKEEYQSKMAAHYAVINEAVPFVTSLLKQGKSYKEAMIAVSQKWDGAHEAAVAAYLYSVTLK